MLTGANDEAIKIWNSESLELITTVDCKTLLKDSVCKSIRAIDVFQNQILIGTLGSEIYTINSSEKIESITNKAKFKDVEKHMSGHFAPNYVTNEVWGLTLYDENQYATCSDDGTFRLWDIEKR